MTGAGARRGRHGLRCSILAATAAVMLGFLLLADAASAHVTVSLEFTENNVWELKIVGDEADDRIALSCASNSVLLDGEVLVNSRTAQHMECGGPEAPQEIHI